MYSLLYGISLRGCRPRPSSMCREGRVPEDHRIRTFRRCLSLRIRRTCRIPLWQYKLPRFSAYFRLRPLCRMCASPRHPRSRNNFYMFSGSYRLQESNRDRARLSSRLPSLRTSYTYGSCCPLRYKLRSSSLPTRRRYDFRKHFHMKRNPIRNMRRESGREPLSGVSLLISSY